MEKQVLLASRLDEPIPLVRQLFDAAFGHLYFFPNKYLVWTDAARQTLPTGRRPFVAGSVLHDHAIMQSEWGVGPPYLFHQTQRPRRMEKWSSPEKTIRIEQPSLLIHLVGSPADSPGPTSQDSVE